MVIGFLLAGLAIEGSTRGPTLVAGVMYVASAAFALAAMMFIDPSVRSYAVALVIIGAGVWIAARLLRLHELNELARGRSPPLGARTRP